MLVITEPVGQAWALMKIIEKVELGAKGAQASTCRPQLLVPHIDPFTLLGSPVHVRQLRVPVMG